MNETVRMLAHEVGNPLTLVLANLHLLRQEMQEWLPREVRELVDDAILGAEQIRDVVADLAVAEVKALDLAKVLDRVVRQSRTAIAQRARFELEIAPDLPVVHGCGSQLSELLINLLINARDAIPPGQPGAHRIGLSACALGDSWVQITIEDTGCGVEPALLPLLFLRGATGRPGGSGLGLALCEEIVTAHGGTIGLESRPGQGTHVTVELPIAGSMWAPALGAGQ